MQFSTVFRTISNCRKRNLNRVAGALVMLSPLIAGCGLNFGPDMISNDRQKYNNAMQATNNEELLLNIVRMRYQETPTFLSVGSIVSNLSVSQSLTGTSQRSEASFFNAVVTLTNNITPSFSYTDTPTISYIPLDGDAFVSEMLTPITANRLFLMNQSGWSVVSIFKLCLTKLNDIWHAPSASRPGSMVAPPFEKFDQALEHLENLGNKVEIRYTVIGKSLQPTLSFAEGALESPDGNKLRKILGLAPNVRNFVIAVNQYEEKDNIINVKTRSMFGILSLMSYAVESPKKDYASGSIAKTITPAGKVFDWRTITNDVFRVQTSSSKPSSSLVAVKHNNNWFFISKKDLDSQAVFVMVSQLLSLQKGTTSTPPTITIPIK